MTAEEIETLLEEADRYPNYQGKSYDTVEIVHNLAALVRELMAMVDAATLREDQATVLYLEARSYLVDALPALRRGPTKPEGLADQIEEHLRPHAPKEVG